MAEGRHALAILALMMTSLASFPSAEAHSGMVLLALDSGGGGNDLEPVNAHRDPAPAKRNNAMTFNGSTSHLVRTGVGTSFDYSSNGGMVYCTWIKSDDSGRNAVIAYFNGMFYLNQSATRVTATWHYGPQSTSTIVVTSSLNALQFGVWRHVCARTSSNEPTTGQRAFQIWLDGGKDQETTLLIQLGESLTGSNGPFYMGGTPTPTGVNLPFKGWIDDTTYCKSALSDTNLDSIQNATSPSTGFCSGSFLGGWWKFDEVVTGAPSSAPASGYIDPTDIVGEAPYSRWMHVRGDTSTLEMRIDVDGDGITDHTVQGNVWSEQVTWDTVGTHLFHVQFIDQFGRAQHNETTVTILAATAAGAILKPTDTTGGTPLTRLVTVEGDHRVVYISVDYDGDGVVDAEVDGATFAATHTWTTPGTYRLNTEIKNDAGVSSYRESIITVIEDAAPTATIYPEPGTRGIAPMTRWIVVRGDPSVHTIRIDHTGDGSWDETVNARTANFEHTWPTPGNVRLVVQLENDRGTVGTYDVPLRIENSLVQDPLTSDRTCGFCSFGKGGGGFGGIDPVFTPKEVWDWLVFLALVAVAGFVLYFRIINGGS